MKFKDLTDIFTYSHPILSLTYIPRIFAVSLCLHIVWCLLGSRLFTVDYLWVFIVGLGWPHVARMLSIKSSNPKKQELINLHLDSFFCAFVACIAPNLQFMGLMVMILCGNTIFIGHFRLMTSSLICFFVPLSIYNFAINPIALVDADITTEAFMLAYAILYFSMCASMGYHLSSKLLALNKKVKQLSVRDPLTNCYKPFVPVRNFEPGAS